MITKIEINTNLKHKYGCDCCIIDLEEPHKKLEGFIGYLAAYCNITLDNYVLLENCKIYEFYPENCFLDFEKSGGVLLNFFGSRIFINFDEALKEKDPNTVPKIIKDFYYNEEKYHPEVIKEFLSLCRNKKKFEEPKFIRIKTVDNSDEHRNQN